MNILHLINIWELTNFHPSPNKASILFKCKILITLVAKNNLWQLLLRKLIKICKTPSQVLASKIKHKIDSVNPQSQKLSKLWLPLILPPQIPLNLSESVRLRPNVEWVGASESKRFQNSNKPRSWILNVRFQFHSISLLIYKKSRNLSLIRSNNWKGNLRLRNSRQDLSVNKFQAKSSSKATSPRSIVWSSNWTKECL